MQSRKVSKSFLSLNFLNFKKTPLHGVSLGVALIVGGWLIALSAVTIAGIIIFVPSAGTVIIKYLKKNILRV